MTRMPGGQPDRSSSPVISATEPGQELVGPAAGVRPGQHLAPGAGGELGQGQPHRLDVVGGGVRPGVPGPERDGQGLAGPGLAVVGEHREGMEPVGVLPGRGGALLVRVRDHDGRVDVDRDQAAAGSGRGGAGQGPGPLAACGPRRADRF
jgi:hypothetical protein